ncbi:MAG: hypothetical protein AB1813_21240 [Verrucomicrobiota bacterium]
MNLLYAILVWMVMGIVLGVGLWLMTAKGSPWLLVVGLLGFILGVARIGCRTH